VLSIEAQVERGALVCPETRERLVIGEAWLKTAGGGRRYEIIDGVPMLLPSRSVADDPAAARAAAERSAAPREPSELQLTVDRLLSVVGDQRSRESRDAWDRFTGRLSDSEVNVAVGGGPRRFHPALVNLNIERFDNVDVVGDAHHLPYADESVAAIQCEAVLEHLQEPYSAVEEMYRVLEPGGEVYCITPFLQGFHGYPNHFFNPTREGHRLLFSRSGFEIRSAGVCVGPSWMISAVLVEYLSILVPVRGIRGALMTVARVLLLPFPLLDRWLNSSPRAHVLASTTFVHARKPS
jgi:SAM-dependent methyltransferase